MATEHINKIVVMKTTIKFLRICYLFPNDEEINQPEKNVFVKYTILTIIGALYPVGIAIHLLLKLRSKCY